MSNKDDADRDAAIADVDPFGRPQVRQQMPPIPLAGRPKPVVVHLDFNAETVDAMLERLSVLRAQMLPAPQRN
jgi:hypothetical protein